MGHRVPLALLIAVVYLVGAATGGSRSRCCVRSYAALQAKPHWLVLN